MLKNTLALMFIASLALPQLACGGAAAEPKSPEERIAEDEQKLDEMQEESHGTGGAELDAKKIEEDLEKAEAAEESKEEGQAAGENAEEASHHAGE